MTTYARQYVRWRWTDGSDTAKWSALYESDPMALPITAKRIKGNGGIAYYSGETWKIDFTLVTVDAADASTTTSLSADDTVTLLLIDERGTVDAAKSQTEDISVDAVNNIITAAFDSADSLNPGVYSLQLAYEGDVIAAGVFEVLRKHTES
jgi:hypothetical protein